MASFENSLAASAENHLATLVQSCHEEELDTQLVE